MSQTKMKKAFSIIGLFLISIVWGLSFVFMKDAISQAPVLYVLAIRFLIAGIPLALIFFKRLLKGKKEDYIRGLIIGLVLTCSYLFQGYGCKFTTASKSALLSSVYGVVVPFTSWLIFKKKPNLTGIFFAVLAFLGIGLITINGFDAINLGDVLTLIGGIIFAFQISLVSEFSKKSDPVILTVTQFLVLGIILICFAPLDGAFPTYLFTNVDLLWRMLLLGFVCTMLCFLFQSICQKNVQVVTSGIIISLEAPFGVIAGVLMNDDSLTAMMIAGIVILVGAVIGMQIYEPILQKIKSKRENQSELAFESESKENVEEDFAEESGSDCDNGDNGGNAE